ncbi:hypothetical protein IW262DRAFT_1465958 [Armillaria fumosa]|nr:hypothetical protein IW262DRAFT_1465958 [Armillaria fumosa]
MRSYPQVFFPPEPSAVASPDPPVFVLGPLLREKFPPPSTQKSQPKDYSDAESDTPTERRMSKKRFTLWLIALPLKVNALLGKKRHDVLLPLPRVPKTPSGPKLPRLPSTGQREHRCKGDAKRRLTDQEPPSPSPAVRTKKKVLTKRMPVWCTSRALVPRETGLIRAPTSNGSDLWTSSPSGGKRGRGYEADDESEKPKKKVKAVEGDNVLTNACRDTTEVVRKIKCCRTLFDLKHFRR